MAACVRGPSGSNALTHFMNQIVNPGHTHLRSRVNSQHSWTTASVKGTRRTFSVSGSKRVQKRRFAAEKVRRVPFLRRGINFHLTRL